jgi:hypothetical protein
MMSFFTKLMGHASQSVWPNVTGSMGTKLPIFSTGPLDKHAAKSRRENIHRPADVLSSADQFTLPDHICLPKKISYTCGFIVAAICDNE